MWYILKDNIPIKSDIIEYSKWSTTNLKDKCVKKDRIGHSLVSTVFLGLDHSFDGGTPVLWETMIFGGKEDMYQDRYTSYEEALVGHQKAINLVKKNTVFLVKNLDNYKQDDIDE